jgi:hypothetical protein
MHEIEKTQLTTIEIINVSTIGLVTHSIADGLALGASLFCKSF